MLSFFSFFLHPLVAEHAAINFQPIAQSRTACTKTFCLRAQGLGSIEKKNKVLNVFLGGICFRKSLTDKYPMT